MDKSRDMNIFSSRVCQLCGKEFPDYLVFHKHLRSHKITQTVYYQTHFPRYDKYDGSIIKFKNREYYFSADFNSKENFKNWLAKVGAEASLDYCIKFLAARKERKHLNYAPTQVELKTLMMPGMRYIDEVLGGFDKLMARVGLMPRFTKKQLEEGKFKSVANKVIFTDSREQKPLELDNTTRTEGLKFGDYRMAGSTISIERKSLGDAWGTLTGGFDRFEREILRAKAAGAYMVILVESPFSSLEKFPFSRAVYGKIKLPVEFVYHSIRDLLQRYQHIQFLFVKDREEASRIVTKLFAADEQVRNVDLQYLYDIGKL